MSTPQSLIISVQQGVTVVEFPEELKTLNESHVDELGSSILELAENATPPLVVLDLTPVEFFGSAFIEVLFRAWNRLSKREGGKFGICGLTPYCQEVIEVTHLDRLWQVYPTSQAAVDALRVEN